MGPHEQTIAKQAMRAGMPLPERIENAPELQLGLSTFLDAFFDLDTERTHDFGLKPIPWSSIANYADAFDYDNEARQDLFYLIKHMDIAHLKRLKEKAPKKGKK